MIEINYRYVQIGLKALVSVFYNEKSIECYIETGQEGGRSEIKHA